MKLQELKECCDLISLVAQAVFTNTIEEAEDYLLEKYDDPNSPLFQHVFNVLDNVKKQQQSEGDTLTFLHTEIYYG